MESDSDNVSSPQAVEQARQRAAGSSLERGLLTTVRQWVDVFGWIRLGRVMRMAGSPPIVTTVLAMTLLWVMVTNVAGSRSLLVGWGPLSSSQTPIHLPVPDVSWVSAVIGCSLWMLFVVPTILLLMRQGALLVAGREMTGLFATLKYVGRRTPHAWLAMIIPVACTLPFALAVWLLSLLGGLNGTAGVFSWLVGFGIFLASLPAGVLLFGALVAVPLSWSAIVNEREPDVLDALSRGYEYLYRRPLQLLLYLAVTGGLLWVIAGLYGCIAQTAVMFAASTSIDGPAVPAAVSFFAILPVVGVITVFFGCCGGIYLLLRLDAGGQEPEDLWVDGTDVKIPLPNLPAEST